MFGEALFDIEGDMRRFEDPLVGSFRRVMVFEGFRADPFFGEKFHGGAEEVMKEPPFVAIEVIEERDNLWII
jgi:hypothetical protein